MPTDLAADSPRPALQRALVTGASGFAGGHLCELLQSQSHALLGLSRHGLWPDDFPPTLGAIAHCAWDLAQAAEPNNEVGQAIEAFAPTVIYHTAALSIPAQCGAERPTAEAWAANVEGTHRIVELALRLPSRPRLVLVSSSHVYGPPRDAEERFSEESPTRPQSGYAHTKCAAEMLVRQAVERRGLDGVIVRAFQHAGPRQRRGLMLSDWVAQFAAAGSTPVTIRSRDVRLDFSDVRDVVRAYHLVAERAPPGTLVNVGSGVPLRSGEVIDHLRMLADPGREVIETAPGPKLDPLAEISFLARLTAWRPRVPWRQTVADTYDSWRSRANRPEQAWHPQ